MGFEQSAHSPENTPLSDSGRANSGAPIPYGRRSDTGTLAAWLAACPDEIPTALRVGIEAMVKATRGKP